MFRRFRLKTRVYGNRRHECSFKATINCLIWNDGELVGLQNCYLGFFFENFEKCLKFSTFFLFQNCPPQNQNFQKKTWNMLVVNGWWICVQNFKSISSKMAEIWYKKCKNRHFSRHFGTLPWFTEFYFLIDFDASKSALGSFSRSLRKSDPKTCIAALNHDFFCLTFFTWWPEMTLTSIMVTKHRKR